MKDELDTRAGVESADLTEIAQKIRARTPARLLAGRAGTSYRTGTQLELREAHAAARDAVRAELDTKHAFGSDFVDRWELFDVWTKARSKEEYLLRPDLGRQLSDEARALVRTRCSRGNDVQIAIGDGLSMPAVQAQVPRLLPLLYEGVRERSWTVGSAFVIHHCRVGVLNEIGELLEPRVAVLLIGERPGLATVESLSAYMAYRPRASHTDAQRNLISNIHGRGLRAEEAAERILDLTARMMDVGRSGWELGGKSGNSR
jgi:ethanolamine ammonia-lyase small subunit